MMRNSNTKRNILIFFVLSISFLIGAFFYTKSSFPKNLTKETEKVQAILTEKELFVEKIIEDIDKKLLSGSVDDLIKDDGFSNESDPNGCLFFVYHDSTLKYWSDNSLIIPSHYLSSDTSTTFAFLSNGWYIIKKKSTPIYLIFGLIKIKNQYTYENQYLRNEFNNDLNLPNNLLINTSPSKYNLTDRYGNYLFSLEVPKQMQISGAAIILPAALYLLAYVFLIITLYFGYIYFSLRVKNNWIIFFGFVFDVLLVRFIIFYFKIPNALYHSKLFSPIIYASSHINPSLGDLLVNSITLLAISFFIYKNFKPEAFLEKASRLRKYFSALVSTTIIFILLIFLYSFLTSLIFNSKLSFDLYKLTTIDSYSIIGLLCFGLLILSFVFFTYKFAVIITSIFPEKKSLFYFLLLYLVFLYLVNIFLIKTDKFILILLFLYIYSLSFFRNEIAGIIRIPLVINFLVIFSLFSTYIVHNSNKKAEKELRTMLAQKLSNNRDYGVEYLFDNIIKSMRNDITLTTLLHEYIAFKDFNQGEPETYIRQKYFTGYWDKFDILITLCDTSKVLEIQPENYEANCYEYFDQVVAKNGVKTDCVDLFYLDSDYSVDNYLGIIEFPNINLPIRINVEFFTRLIPRGLGYPELLNDQKTQSSVQLSQYSWARYEKGDLIYHFGKYSYSLSLLNYQNTSNNNKNFFNLNNYNHLYFPVDKNTILIISQKNPGFIDIVAPFSYFFIFYGILLLLLRIFYKGPIILKIPDLSIKRRLQLFITALIILSFLFVGISSLFYITTLNNNKNQELLSEKAHSVLIEIEHKLAGEQMFTLEIQQYLSDLLYKFSMVFFSDINLYDLDGTLIATSRPEIFNRGLISSKMDPGAFYQMSINKNSSFIHNESIGDYMYLSAYLPFRNENNKLIAFLNLPYFAKQEELTNDISTYLVALINIYVILIALAIFIALVVSKYVTKPVEMIKDKISRLKLGKTNEKIEWGKNDEIGGLVMEYNRMVDELALSAERLAKSERESAWREMARQIAHEIKNPLTPMKLSVQYLQKAWDEKAPDWDMRLQRFTHTIVEQIESLSSIASEFSDFAKMPKSNFEKIEINKIIDHSISLFKDTTPIQFDFKPSVIHIVYADKEQLLRVFINLINNSIQAILNPEKGHIDISVEAELRHIIIKFTDNGIGIPSDQKHRVFYPNFTTKSGGTGLGLAMVKNIIQNSKGEITFESSEGKGTTFIIRLPVSEE